MSAVWMLHPVLFAAIRRECQRTPNRAIEAAVGHYQFCVAQIEQWGHKDGRNFVLGPLVDLLDFFVNPETPEAKELARQASAFACAGQRSDNVFADAQPSARGGRRTDYGVLMQMAALAVTQGSLPADVGERLRAEIGWMIWATERAH